MKEFIKNLKFVWTYAKDQRWRLFGYVLCNIINIVISIVIPIISAGIIVSLTTNQFDQLILMSIIILGVEVSRNFVTFFAEKFSQVIYRESFTKIQTHIGKEILRLENKSLDENGTGVFIQRLTNDASQLSNVFNTLSIYLSGVFRDIGILGAIFIINKIVFFYVIILILILYFIERIRVVKYNENDKIFRKKNDKISGFSGELVRGARDIKMLNAEASFINRLHTKIIDLNKSRYKMQEVDRNYSLFDGTIKDFSGFLMIMILVVLIKKGSLESANALVLYNYFGSVIFITYYIRSLLQGIKDFNLSAERVFSVIDSKEFPKEKFGDIHIDKVEGNFEFRDVSFSYDKGEVLDKVSFKIKANETVAFVGKSGAGKTTIFSLLCKMYDATSGTITIDGVNINDIDKDTIRGSITVISQNPYIFNLSIKENFQIVKEDVTDEEIYEACHLACLDHFIEKLPDKYETIIGEGGINLSGGQRQRLAIARALVQKTEIILFDEATSSLDNETQSSIQKAINNMKDEYTILIIAHRLSTIINCDRILFLNNGKIEEAGTHQELLKKSKNYKTLYESEVKK